MYAKKRKDVREAEMKKKLFALLEVADENNKTSLIYDFYDIFMI